MKPIHYTTRRTIQMLGYREWYDAKAIHVGTRDQEALTDISDEYVERWMDAFAHWHFGALFGQHHHDPRFLARYLAVMNDCWQMCTDEMERRGWPD